MHVSTQVCKLGRVMRLQYMQTSFLPSSRRNLHGPRRNRQTRQVRELHPEDKEKRRKLQTQIQQKRFEATKQQTELYKDLASYKRMQERQNMRVTERFNQGKPKSGHTPTFER